MYSYDANGNKVTRTGAPTEYRHTIRGGKGAAAIHVRRSNGTSDTYYVHKDHLGSPELITGSGGSVVVRMSFSAYGERRDGADWSGPAPAGDLSAIANATRRGFTGHEHLDHVGLIHMNGRVYEPRIGRFLGADPIVVPGASQGANPYAYVWNNPLRFTDPSGFDPEDAVTGRPSTLDLDFPWNDYWLTSPDDFFKARVRITPPIPPAPDYVPPAMQVPKEGRATFTTTLALRSSATSVDGSNSCNEVTKDLGVVICDAQGNRIATIYAGVGGMAKVAGGARPVAARALARLLARYHSSRLNRAMAAAGQVKPTGHAAHHIVPHGAERAEQARRVLDKYGIGIDDAVNGVYLPRSVEAGAGAIHRGGHSKAYYDLVNDALSRARSKEDAIAILKRIADGLRNGSLSL